VQQGAGGPGLWAPPHRALTIGLVLNVTFVASEALAVVTIMPVVARDLGGLSLYGWAFSAFMLGSVAGIVTAGHATDRRGPAGPFVAGLVLFGAGLAVGGLAPDMPVLVAGRVLQGTGAGAVPAVAYAAIGRSLAGPAQARMMAVLSTAWVAPGLIGPAIAAEVAHAFGWRWVFLGLLPVVAVSGSLAVPALIRLGRPAATGTSPSSAPGAGVAQKAAADPAARDGAGSARLLADGVRTAVCAALILAGLTLAAGSDLSAALIAAGAALVVAGIVAGLPALRRLMPPGTLTARAGLPATILSRGALTFAFFGTDSYVTLSITTLRHQSPVVASVAVTGVTLTWSAGAWVQARLAQTRAGRNLIRAGLVIIMAGIGGLIVMLQPGVPVLVGQVSWTVAGLGMGLAYPTISLLMLRQAPPGEEGVTSAALTLADVLGTALGIGIGGAAVTAGTGHDLRAGVLTAFGIAIAAGVAALFLTRRLPPGPVAAPPAPSAPDPAATPSSESAAT
jgi:MFS family permease